MEGKEHLKHRRAHFEIHDSLAYECMSIESIEESAASAAGGGIRPTADGERTVVWVWARAFSAERCEGAHLRGGGGEGNSAAPAVEHFLLC